MTELLSHTRLLTSWPDFSRNIRQFLEELGLADLGLECDHVALRVNTTAVADALRDEFCSKGTIISNNIINGRPILIIELNTPLRLGNLNIDCIELPYPSNKHYPVEGWEHIELVLPCQATSCDTLAQILIEKVPHLAHIIENSTDIKVKLSSPSGEHERLANPTIAFKKGNICIKLHPYGIKQVINSEVQSPMK
ncbi:VOC family protein [Shewanella sp. VB17]|uniref:VOC family protein n=1 Tax=Shewanella sp. VB17 TaxID=2739432 RepID=UPI001563568B|nr:VOC family protein [Shewanella sp. VB17]NRD74255.1 VOC family protein [Shewanella sp. VB17]